MGHLSKDKLESGRANALLRHEIIPVTLFDDGAAMRDFAANILVRGGGTAINKVQCAANPTGCGLVNFMLQRSPALTYVPGVGFRHKYALTPPSPPPPPYSPPTLLVYATNRPPPSPPPSPSPPPYYTGSEMCVPIATPAEFGAIDILDDDDRERAVCLYVRALKDELIDAKRCFSPISPSPPPPPPTPEGLRGLVQTYLEHARQRNGGTKGPTDEPIPGTREAYAQEQADKIQETINLIDNLSKDNYRLRDVLSGMREKFETGRRLFETADRSHVMTDNTISVEALGGAPILGITRTECTALCTSVVNDTAPFQCVGTATRMLDPSDLSDLSVASCWLLKSLGSCRTIDWAAAVYARRDTSPCDLPDQWSNPLCVSLSPELALLHVLDYAMSAATCRNGRGQPVLANPHTFMESASMVAYARERVRHNLFLNIPIRIHESPL
jgi:hypothetical protein